jgi:hypothetical protein
MALTSPGVEVTIIDQSQYLPAPTNSVPLVVLATAQNKADASGTAVAVATTAANAGKLYQVTSQRDLVNLYGTPFFYTTTNGTPIQGYELNEYGLLAAYSLLGVTNRCYVLRADIDLGSLVGQTGRPVGAPANASYWLDTTTSTWGIYEFNASTGQFELQIPIVITDSTSLSGGVPLNSIGNIGQYAVNAIMTDSSNPNFNSQYFYKTTANEWVILGSNLWAQDVPAVQGTQVSTSSTNPLTAGDQFTINLSTISGITATITVPASPNNTAAGVATQINNLGWGYLTALADSTTSNKLQIFSSQPQLTQNISLVLTQGSGDSVLDDLGISSNGGTTPGGTFFQPALVFGTASQMPLWTSSQTYPRPTGSVWVKVGTSGNGLSPVVAQYNSTTGSWLTQNVTLSTSDWAASATLDSTGGQAIPAGALYAQYSYNASGNYSTSAYNAFNEAPIFLWERSATGPTVATGTETNWVLDNITGTTANIFVQISTPNSASLDSTVYTVGPLSDGDGPEDFVLAWQDQNIPYTTCTVTTDGAIQLTHTEGGEIIISDWFPSSSPYEGEDTTILEQIGFIPDVTTNVKTGVTLTQQYTIADPNPPVGGSPCAIRVAEAYGQYRLVGTGVPFFGDGYAVGDEITIPGTSLGGATPANDLVVVVTKILDDAATGEAIGVTYVSGDCLPQDYAICISNWVALDFTANEGAPVAIPTNGTNWFYSVADQVDIMVNYNGVWNGYRNLNYDSSGFPSATGTNATDPNGPIVSASEPVTQSDGTTALAYGDIWIDTSDLETYPLINRWQLVSGQDQWVRLDNTDQTSSTGVAFLDARWGSNGSINPADDPVPTITSLLTSNYVDLDAPSPSLYPNGILLFNTRRSGYNVKQFTTNYFTSANYPTAGAYDPSDTTNITNLPLFSYTWVTSSGNQLNGAPYMGRQAQRAMVVASLRSVIDTNADIRDEDNYFNLQATPYYPELQPNMIALNAARGDTSYIIGDTPMRLPAQATAIQAWATNAAGAAGTGEEGLVTRNEYMGLFYPSGLTNDLAGNVVAVPPSHMMLSTFLRNDTISYPWLAAAGTRRGTINNAAQIGYLDATTGEFITTKTQLGIRDVLYINLINPLVFFTGIGLLNYGNKSSRETNSALNRTNVSRLVNYVRRQLTLASRPFVFEPNDALTRNQIAGVVETLMVDLVAKRGIYDYLVVCDESNNTPARIDANELWIDVAIEPVKAAEFIYIPVRVLNTGELSQ